MMTPPRSREIIFIIDDDAAVRDALSRLIRSVGFEVAAFSSTVDFLQARHPDVPSCLVLDVRLQGVSGLDFPAELARANRHIPVIFITGHGDIPMGVRAMKAGAVEFLTKPFREQDLLDAIQLGLERDSIRRANEEVVFRARSVFDTLTAREQEVMALVTAGLMNKQIAAKMAVSEITVKVHRGNVMRKMGAKSIAELVRMADALGLNRLNL